MKKAKVRFEGGESRYGSYGVDYMLAIVGGHELYAEVDPLDYAEEAGSPVEVDEATYAVLKRLMLEEAWDAGVPAEMLEFPWE